MTVAFEPAEACAYGLRKVTVAKVTGVPKPTALREKHNSNSIYEMVFGAVATVKVRRVREVEGVD